MIPDTGYTMHDDTGIDDTSALFGANPDERLVAVDMVVHKDKPNEMALFYRKGDSIVTGKDELKPFILADARMATECEIEHELIELPGDGRMNSRLVFPSWDDCIDARNWFHRRTGVTPNAPGAPYLYINDPVRQYLTTSGRTLFKGMNFKEVKRMQVDIECITSEGYEFCNSARKGDEIVAIAMADETGWVKVLSGKESGEKQLLEEFVQTVSERDPDVIEGHNIFNFDLPYITARAKRHKVKLTLGRDGSTPVKRRSRMSIGERAIAYSRYNVFGRHVVDTLFLVQAFDISERAMQSFGLKDVAVHLGVAAEDRTYVEGAMITETYKADPDALLRYVHDDVVETRAVSDLLSQSYFVQATMLPYSYQNVCVRGNATKIDSLMLREYIRLGRAVPLPGIPRRFSGGYTDLFFQGVAENVHHCDIRSLYPSLMLAEMIGPATDDAGAFLSMLDQLRSFRIDSKEKALAASDDHERTYYDALQKTFKILINSFYGYLGFAQGKFSDFDAAERVTAEGRAIMKLMIRELEDLGAKLIEIDTDGIYFVPPELKSKGAIEKFRNAMREALPDGIEIEFDGEYRAMYSYKMKNYALLHHDGEMTIKGAALRSRGLARFQRSFLRKLIRLRLEGCDKDIPALREEYAAAIEGQDWPVEEFAKTSTLQDSPSTYATKKAQKSRGRDAAYELALRSDRKYRAGDQLTFYVTGTRKSVAVHEAAKLATEWDPEDRDENIPYYLAKLDAMYKKFYPQEP